MAIYKVEPEITKEDNRKLLTQLPTQVQPYFSSPYGKNSLNHSFTTHILFQYTLLHFELSGFFEEVDIQQLLQVLSTIREFLSLITDYKCIAFSPLRITVDFLQIQYPPEQWI